MRTANSRRHWPSEGYGTSTHDPLTSSGGLTRRRDP